MRFLLFIVLFVFGADSSANNTEKLHQLFSDAWNYQLSVNPDLALALGDSQAASKLYDVSSKAYKKQAKKITSFIKQLADIERQNLSFDDQISYDMFQQQLANILADIEFKEYQFAINSESSFHIDLARTHAQMAFRNMADYLHYLNRLEQVEQVIDHHIENMRQGLKRGFTQPRVIIEHFPEHIRQYIKSDPTQTAFFKPFENLPKNMGTDNSQQLLAKAKRIISKEIMPAYQRFHDFMKNEYLPGARTDIGASSLPNGKAYYQQQIQEYTTLNLTPEEIHQIGRKEVKRIRTEMEALIQKTDFNGSFAEFIHFLRTDPRFYAKSAGELLKEARNHAKKMDGKLPQLFTRLPRQPYAVNPVPAAIAPNYTTGRYVDAPLDSTRPGQYWVNTHALEKRPLYNLEALTLHEAVPGHHLQISLSKELDHLPNFRRYNYISAHGEGWGLYSEKLGKEVGFYQDPYSDFGRLTYEMWRAMRLVVDTGMHAMGMSRDEAIQLMEENTALSSHNVRTEIDRYIGWPGQALSYKLGEIKIWQLRALAEKELGERFDIRVFHDTLIGSGSVSLDGLEKIINQYIQKTNKTL
ncbi:DUF885 domain-containing protein [Marinicella sp. W31]|uniref:DUF885 domain-containing protein n=1 Tax=Marinicella sp. W31 TaxID=3023713 RepID=UPI00375635BA